MPTNVLAVQFPLKINSETGALLVYTMSELQSVIEQNIKMILLTNPGERLFNDNFGVGLSRYLFLQESQILNGVPGDDRFPPLRQYIRTQLQAYMPYITVENILLSTKQNLLNVQFKYYVNNSATAFEFDLTISDVS